MDEVTQTFPTLETAGPVEALCPGVTVVVPTRRLAHHLRARHDASCVARGLATWRTPDVVTWSELIRRLFEADRAAGLRSDRWLEPSQGLAIWEGIVRRDADEAGVLAARGLGSRVQRSWNLMHEYLIPSTALGADSSPEVQAFARWVDEYRRQLRRQGWLDAAEAAAVVRAPRLATEFELAGFDTLTPLQQGTFQRFVAAGVTVRSRPSAVAASTRPRLARLNDFDSEIESAARWLAEFLARRPAARAALVVPALASRRDRVRHVLDRVLVPAAAPTGGPAPESTAYELAAARPLAARPLVASALSWLEAAAGQPALGDVSALLRSPYDAAAAEAPARAGFDVWLRRWQPQLSGLHALAEHASRRPGLGETARITGRLAARVREWRDARLPSRWVPEFFSLLRDLGWPGPGPDSAAHQAVERWQLLLGEFAAADEVAGPMPASTAVARLRALAADTSFEPQEVAAPLLVIDPDTAAGMRFDAVWICGLDATRWPSPASPDPFLPRDWQSRQGVPGATAELSGMESRRTFDRLCGSADEVICSVAGFEDEAPLLPSTLVTGLEPCGRLESWAGPSAAEQQFAARPVLESIVDGALPELDVHEVARGGAHLLELQARCPFRAAVELRLGGRELQATETGVSPIERGNLVHSVLQLAWQELHTHARLAAMPEDELVAWVGRLAADAISNLRAESDPVRLRLLEMEREWLAARVLEMLREDRGRPPFEVLQVEEPYTLEIGPLQVRLKIDRVDRLADGSLAVIDYKSGLQATPAAWMRERPALPQLPLYVRAVGPERVGAVAFGVVRKGATGYLGYVRERSQFPQLTQFEPGKRPFDEYDSWDGLLATWSRRLDALALEHARGDARLAPDPRKACRHCHLPGLCRLGQAVADEEGPDADAQ